MLHLTLHLIVPVAVAFVFYRRDAVRASLLMLATMAVDIDHLLADPIYDPNRCSIGLHPLHTAPAILVYGAAFVLTIVFARRLQAQGRDRRAHVVHLVALGLLIHMALDGLDCLT